MKRILICISALFMVLLLLKCPCAAAELDAFDDEIKQLEDSVDEETAEGLSSLGIESVQDIISYGVDDQAIWSYLCELISKYSRGPLSALLILSAALILTSIAESYTFSLRYTDTREILGVIVSLFTATVAVSPITELVSSALTVIQGSATVMTAYVPLMAGIMMFSGHAVSSGGWYAAALAASQLLSRLASSVLAPLLNIILSLSVCSSICSRIRLSGFIETVSKAFKYTVTFAMSIFTAVIGLNGTLSGAADSVANKAAKFTLSSFIPLIGSSVSEAYGAIQSSVGILRSGIGVFVIIAVFVAFAPIIARTILWSVALTVAKTVGEALAVSSSSTLFNALIQFISALRTLLIAVMTAFIISSAIMLTIGGRS